ncbi:MAG: hypothetical protein ACKO6B_13060 [Planctomycetia bacterium]
MFRSFGDFTSSRARMPKPMLAVAEPLESRAMLAGDDHGHAGDLHVHVEDNKLSTDHGAYGWEFVDEGGGFVADIGFDAEDLPADSSLRLMPKTNLLYWNGVGPAANFMLAAGTTSLTLEGTEDEINLGAIAGLGDFLTIAAEEQGSVHEHIAAAIGSAPRGVYAFYASVTSSDEGIGGSKPIAFVLNRGMSERIHDRAIAALEDRPIVVSAVTSTANGTLKAGQTIDIAVTYSEAVIVRGRPEIVLDVGGASRAARHVAYDAETMTSTFRYTVSAQDPVDADGIGVGRMLRLALGSSIRAAEGNATALRVIPRVDGSGILIDTSIPRLTRIEATVQSTTYTAGQTLEFLVRFSKPVIVTGTPSLRFVTGGNVRFAGDSVYVSGSNSRELTFRYTVQPTDAARGGVSLRRAFALLGNSTVRDSLGNAAVFGAGIFAFPDVKVRPAPVVS